MSVLPRGVQLKYQGFSVFKIEANGGLVMVHNWKEGDSWVWIHHIMNKDNTKFFLLLLLLSDFTRL
jgi:hypothetical protein